MPRKTTKNPQRQANARKANRHATPRRGADVPQNPSNEFAEDAPTPSTPSLLTLTRQGFDTLRARIQRADSSNPSDQVAKERRIAKPLSDALARLSADYERVLRGRPT
jgi:hypothetical protein